MDAHLPTKPLGSSGIFQEESTVRNFYGNVVNQALLSSQGLFAVIDVVERLATVLGIPVHFVAQLPN